MHAAYAIIMTMLWVVGTLSVILCVGVIISRRVTEEVLYQAGIQACRESKEKEKEALEDLVEIFEEMLRRMDRREHRAVLRIVKQSEKPPIHSLFDLSDVSGVQYAYG